MGVDLATPAIMVSALSPGDDGCFINLWALNEESPYREKDMKTSDPRNSSRWLWFPISFNFAFFVEAMHCAACHEIITVIQIFHLQFKYLLWGTIQHGQGL